MSGAAEGRAEALRRFGKPTDNGVRHADTSDEADDIATGNGPDVKSAAESSMAINRFVKLHPYMRSEIRRIRDENRR